MSIFEICLRLVVAALLGGAIGFERERHGRVAGFRTHVLVTLGSTLLMMVSLHLYDIFKVYNTTNYASGVDPSRIASLVIVGIGFIGAGTIIKNRGGIQGLTTAACLWMSAALGLAIGCGYYLPALIATFISLCTLILLKRFEMHMEKDKYHSVKVCIKDGGGGIEDINSVLSERGFTILKVVYKKDLVNKKICYDIYVRTRLPLQECLIHDIGRIEGIESISCD